MKFKNYLTDQSHTIETMYDKKDVEKTVKKVRGTSDANTRVRKVFAGDMLDVWFNWLPPWPNSKMFEFHWNEESKSLSARLASNASGTLFVLYKLMDRSDFMDFLNKLNKDRQFQLEIAAKIHSPKKGYKYWMKK